MRFATMVRGLRSLEISVVVVRPACSTPIPDWSYIVAQAFGFQLFKLLVLARRHSRPTQRNIGQRCELLSFLYAPAFPLVGKFLAPRWIFSRWFIQFSEYPLRW